MVSCGLAPAPEVQLVEGGDPVDVPGEAGGAPSHTKHLLPSTTAGAPPEHRADGETHVIRPSLCHEVQHRSGTKKSGDQVINLPGYQSTSCVR